MRKRFLILFMCLVLFFTFFSPVNFVKAEEYLTIEEVCSFYNLPVPSAYKSDYFVMFIRSDISRIYVLYLNEPNLSITGSSSRFTVSGSNVGYSYYTGSFWSSSRADSKFTFDSTFDFVYANFDVEFGEEIDSVPDENLLNYYFPLVPEHEHLWSDVWSYDDTYHWYECINSDGNCDLSAPSDMDSYAAHIFDDEQDVDCNTCGFIRSIVPVIPSVSPTPTNTPTPIPSPRPTSTPTPTPPPYLVGGYDENGNWVGYTQFEADSLNHLQDIKIVLDDVLYFLKNLCALMLILVVFETLKITRAWVKGVGLK